MVVIIEGSEAGDHCGLVESMFEDRKKLFIDLLNWDVPVVDGRFEKDRFDDEHATYLITVDEAGTHAGSLRLLSTSAPHILSEFFPSLCDDGVPCGPTTFEITRLCLPARHRAATRLAIRNRLISAMVDHSLRSGIEWLTGVVEAGFRDKVLDMGWEARALGAARRIDGALLGAFLIDIREGTPKRLASRGIYTPDTICLTPPERVAA